jgi:glycosyltransferase involved in cell wall biosynthesis
MKILHIIDSLETGGAELLLKQICDGQIAQGMEPSVYVCRRHAGELDSSFRRARISLFESGCRQLKSPLQVIALARHFQRFRYDVVHVHLFPAQLWAALAAALVPLSCEFVTTEHNTWNRRREPIWRPLDRWMYRRYDAVICITDAVRANLRQWILPYRNELAVIPNGIDLTRFVAAPNRTNRKPDTILSVGSLSDRKDHATLLRAAGQLESVQVLIAGDGPLRNSLRKLCAELRLHERVRFLGRRDDIPELMASAEVYVQPSRVEGFGLAPLEAMAAGLPVIASDAPGMREVVDGAALTFPVGNADALAGRLRDLLSKPELRAELSRASLRRAAQFSIDRTVEGYQMVYEAVRSRQHVPSLPVPGPLLTG